MSERPPPGPPPPPRAARPPDPPPQERSGCLTALLVFVGIILLLPGLCTVIVSNGHVGDENIAPITKLTFGVGFCGLILILLGVAVYRRDR